MMSIDGIVSVALTMRGAGGRGDCVRGDGVADPASDVAVPVGRVSVGCVSVGCVSVGRVSVGPV
ncbi:hypothetical protein, partial [Streptomyces sp. SID3212]|uniref:hypothetical protein n=1 Tax=Streptomyces sp. SID3212 TaxID=2690259 RepID=UPI001F246BAE